MAKRGETDWDNDRYKVEKYRKQQDYNWNNYDGAQERPNDLMNSDIDPQGRQTKSYDTKTSFPKPPKRSWNPLEGQKRKGQGTDKDFELTKNYEKYLGRQIGRNNSSVLFEKVRFEDGREKKYKYLVYKNIIIKRSEKDNMMKDLKKPRYQDTQGEVRIDTVRARQIEFNGEWKLAVERYGKTSDKNIQDAVGIALPENVINDIQRNVEEKLELKSKEIFNRLFKELEGMKGPPGFISIL